MGILMGAERSWDCFLTRFSCQLQMPEILKYMLDDPAPQEQEYICQGAPRGFLTTAMEISLSERKTGGEHQLCYASPHPVLLMAVTLNI